MKKILFLSLLMLFTFIPSVVFADHFPIEVYFYGVNSVQPGDTFYINIKRGFNSNKEELDGELVFDKNIFSVDYSDCCYVYDSIHIFKQKITITETENGIKYTVPEADYVYGTYYDIVIFFKVNEDSKTETTYIKSNLNTSDDWTKSIKIIEKNKPAECPVCEECAKCDTKANNTFEICFYVACGICLLLLVLYIILASKNSKLKKQVNTNVSN